MRFLDFRNHELECFRNIGVQAGTGLGKAALELFREFSTFFCGDLSLLRLQITLVAYNDQWNPIRPLEFGELCRSSVKDNTQHTR